MTWYKQGVLVSFLWACFLPGGLQFLVDELPAGISPELQRKILAEREHSATVIKQLLIPSTATASMPADYANMPLHKVCLTRAGASKTVYGSCSRQHSACRPLLTAAARCP